MHEAYWNGLFDVRWEDAALGSEAIRLVVWLRKRGFSARTRRDYGHAVAHFGKVLDAEREIDPAALNEEIIEDFVCDHLPICRCYQQQPPTSRQANTRWALAHLLTMLREEGVVPPVVLAQPPYYELLEGYSRFLRHDRGLAETTVTNYRRYLRDFLSSRGDAVSRSELVKLTADDLLRFSLQRGAALGVTAWGHLATSLSGFYRWLDLHGHGGDHLIAAVPRRRKYRLADVPCALTWGQVQQLLAVGDRDEANGYRNYAMLLLIATYGLRGCEVRALPLDHIDWAHDEITIFAPKTSRTRKLPLTRSVGEAILDYLRKERRPSAHREVFLSSRPPHAPLRSKINRWLARCLEKAEIETPRGGAHILRHSLAVHLLRSGEALKGIGDVLGHRSPETTFIYTKLHVEDLRTVALDPEVVS